MTIKDILHWIEIEFAYPVPKDYLQFLLNGDFVTTNRKYYVDDTGILEISQWFDYNYLLLAYQNCISEGMIEKYHLPIFDSCNCTVVIDCNMAGNSYGCVFLGDSEDGYFDSELDKNVYAEMKFVAKDFSEIMSRLKTAQELEEAGLL